MQKLKAIWSYRYFILSSIKTEFYTKFVRSKLGGLWIILYPLAQVAIYAVVLSAVLSAKLPGIDSQYAYAIYLMSGIFGWTLFSDILTRCITIFLDNANLIKKMSFPKITLPLIIVGSSLVNSVFLFIAMLVVFALLGHMPNLYIFYAIPLVLIIILLSLGFGLFLGVLNVFLRDIGQIVPIVLQFWFWLTPIVYSWSIIPEKYLVYVMLNPMASVIKSFQNVLAYKRPPDLELLYYPVGVGMFFFVLAIFIYLKANEEMADVL